MAVFYSPAEVVGMAIETEKSGQEFYRAVASTVGERDVGDLFRFLAGEEARHEQVFRGLYDKIRETPSELPRDWDDVIQYLRVITNSRFFLGPGKALALAREAKTETDALDAALQFEKETLLFYLEIAAMVAVQHRSVLDELTRQERMHIRKLSELRARTSPEAGKPQGASR